jgi:hypothetical protein
MNIYQSIGNNVGTPEAAELSDRLAAWHDAMVGHVRFAADTSACDDECPHGEARRLWEEAVQTFGDRAQELRFLRSCGVSASRVPRGTPSRAPREARA